VVIWRYTGRLRLPSPPQVLICALAQYEQHKTRAPLQLGKQPNSTRTSLFKELINRSEELGGYSRFHISTDPRWCKRMYIRNPILHRVRYCLDPSHLRALRSKRCLVCTVRNFVFNFQLHTLAPRIGAGLKLSGEGEGLQCSQATQNTCVRKIAASGEVPGLTSCDKHFLLTTTHVARHV
jgi:hypothetical protein